jgi:hypothetical protein
VCKRVSERVHAREGDKETERERESVRA